MNYVGISLEKPRLSQAQMDDMADLRIVIKVDDHESKWCLISDAFMKDIRSSWRGRDE